MKSSKSKFEISNFDKFKFCILSIDDFVNLFFDASFEKPPDSVAPLKEQRFIIKYSNADCNKLFSSIILLL